MTKRIHLTNAQKMQAQAYKVTRIYRRLLAISGAVYFLWWFACKLLLPNAFNPFLSRFVVILIIFAIYGLSYINRWFERHLKTLFVASAWLITLHYFYLFFENSADINWIIGAYVTIIAINLCFQSKATLISYSGFVIFLSILLVYLLPPLRSSIFLPGIVTILIQANSGLWSRLGLNKTLAESNAHFQVLLNSTFEGILVHENRVVTNVNDSLTQMFGFTRSELVGKDALTIIHPDWRSFVDRRMKFPELSQYESKGLKKDGSVLDLEIRAKTFTYRDRDARLVAIQDITEKKQAERERIAMLTMAENVRVRDEFISLASHELRTPITSLKLQTQLIDRALKQESNLSVPFSRDRLQKALSLFHRQVDRLTELVETMLDVSRISTGRLILEKCEVDLPYLVRDVVRDTQFFSSETGDLTQATITVSAPDQLRVWADRSRVRQVLENLISNAIKYGDGKPIHIGITPEDVSARLDIKDNGVGIAPEFVGHIFDRFERAASVRNIRGLGLGLYIARQIVEAHEGQLSVTSQVGIGSVFTVCIPIGTIR